MQNERENHEAQLHFMHSRFKEVTKAVLKCSQVKFALLSLVKYNENIKYWPHVSTHKIKKCCNES